MFSLQTDQEQKQTSTFFTQSLLQPSAFVSQFTTSPLQC